MSAHPLDAEFTIGGRPAADSGDGKQTGSAGKRRWVVALFAIALLGAISAGLYFYLQPVREAAQPEAKQVAPAQPAAAPSPPAARPAEPEPVPPAIVVPDAPPLPALDASDPVAMDAIRGFAGDRHIALLVPSAIIRHIVATIDALPRQFAPVKVRPLHVVPGLFATEARDGGLAVSATNAARYRAFVEGAEAIDAKRLAGLYTRLYPLFRAAYVDLGYPGGNFHARLLAVIDHLLDAPEIAAPIALTQPKVLYEFADPAQEALSAGQKMMIRVGIDNELRLKAVLRKIRGALPAGEAALGGAR